MKQCKFCRTEIDDKAKVCPQCGRKQPSKVKKIVLIVLIAFCAFIVIAAITGGNESTGNPPRVTGTVETQTPENVDLACQTSANNKLANRKQTRLSNGSCLIATFISTHPRARLFTRVKKRKRCTTSLKALWQC